MDHADHFHDYQRERKHEFCLNITHILCIKVTTGRLLCLYVCTQPHNSRNKV